MNALLIAALLPLSVFMILLVLIQRGKGGGLAGAFGGMGGQSAFGTKAGDVFTKITVVVALVWFFFCGFTVLALKTWGGGHLNVEGANPVAASSTGEAPTTTPRVPTTTPTPATLTTETSTTETSTTEAAPTETATPETPARESAPAPETNR